MCAPVVSLLLLRPSIVKNVENLYNLLRMKPEVIDTLMWAVKSELKCLLKDYNYFSDYSLNKRNPQKTNNEPGEFNTEEFATVFTDEPLYKLLPDKNSSPSPRTRKQLNQLYSLNRSLIYDNRPQS